MLKKLTSDIKFSPEDVQNFRKVSRSLKSYCIPLPISRASIVYFNYLFFCPALFSMCP